MARRLVAVLGLLLAMMTPLPASASSAHTSLSATPATVHVGSAVVLTGTVTPHLAQTIVVQEFVARHWVAIAHAKTSDHFTVTVHAPKSSQTWQLRVAGRSTSRTVRVHVVSRQFTVRASVTSTSPLAVAGSVSPKTAGTVALQALQHNTWHTLTTAHLTKTGTFTLSQTEPAAVYTLRVVRALTASIAAGTSKTLHATVAVPSAPPTTPPAPPAAPSITTTRLPLGTLGVAYSVALKAAGGALPLIWSITSGALPAGLTLAADGQISGTPTSTTTALLTVTVTDSLGRSASLPLGLTVGSGVLRTWGSNMTSPALVAGLGPVVAASAGENTWYAVAADHTLWAFGNNTDGQLGDGSTSPVTAPVHVNAVSGVVGVAASEIAAYAVTSTGSVYSWGYDGDGELGDGLFTAGAGPSPRAVLAVSGAVGVAAVEDGGYAVESNGTVWAWGGGSDGALGDGSTDTLRSTPVRVTGLTSAVAVAAGVHSGYALLADGTVAAWGNNDKGQLGDESGAAQSNTPVIVHDLTGVVAITASSRGAMALKADGTVWAWGLSLLGDPARDASDYPRQVLGLSRITAISAALNCGFALDEDGTMWSWGQNGNGQLGNGTENDDETPTPISGLSHVVAIGGGQHDDVGFAVTWG